jgi:hypothetical protein
VTPRELLDAYRYAAVVARDASSDCDIGIVERDDVYAAEDLRNAALAALEDAIDALEASVAEWRRLAETQDAIIQRAALPDAAERALAKLGAAVMREWYIENEGWGFACQDGDHGAQETLDGLAADVGVHRLTGVMEYELAPGVADAIARLLPPDGAGEVGNA